MTERWEVPVDGHVTEQMLLDLALEELEPVERSAVLAHVQGCPSCRSRFSAIADGMDAVLVAAPSAAPPLGLAQSTLDAIGNRQAASSGRDVRRFSARGMSRRAGVMMAAAAVAALLVGFGLGTLTHPGSRGQVADAEQPAAPEAPSLRALVTGSGERVGEMLIAQHAGRDVFVISVVGRPGAWYSCELVLDDGTSQTAGSWTLPRGLAMWVVDRPDRPVTRMTLVNSSGRIWATAAL